MSKLALAVVVVFGLVILMILATTWSDQKVTITNEDFSSRHQKANASVSYFQGTRNPRYTGYRDALGPDVNIYEYWALSKLAKDNKLTVAEAIKIVN